MNIEKKVTVELVEGGKYLLSIRKKMGIGKEKFGKYCGLSEIHIRNIEIGKANLSLETLVKLKNGISLTITLILCSNKQSFSRKTLIEGRTENFETAILNFSKRLSKILKHRKLKSLSFSVLLGMDESATN